MRIIQVHNYIFTKSITKWIEKWMEKLLKFSFERDFFFFFFRAIRMNKNFEPRVIRVSEENGLEKLLKFSLEKKGRRIDQSIKILRKNNFSRRFSTTWIGIQQVAAASGCQTKRGPCSSFFPSFLPSFAPPFFP